MASRRTRRCCYALVGWSLLCAQSTSVGQTDDSTPHTPDDTPVTLDFPEAVEAQALIDYVSQTLRLNILYDDSIRGKKIILRAPASIPKISLLGLLRSVLRTAGLALVDDDHPGWLRVVQAQALPSHIREIRHGITTQPAAATRVVTQVIPIRHADVSKVTSTLKPFLSTPGGSAVAVEGTGLLIVTDYEATVARLMELIALMDAPALEASIEIIPLRHQDATTVSARVSQILADKSKFQDPEAQAEGALTVTPDAQSQTITLIGFADQIGEAKAFIEQFDVVTPAATTTRRRYNPKFVNADRVKSLIDGVIAGPEGAEKAAIDVFIDPESNTMYVTATRAQHQEIGELIVELDASPPESAKPVRFYKLMNRKAAEVFETLSSLLGEGESAVIEERVEPVRPRVNPGGPTVSGPNRPGAGPGVVRQPSAPPAHYPHERQTSRRVGALRAEGADFKLTVDEATNTLIVAATVEMQAGLVLSLFICFWLTFFRGWFFHLLSMIVLFLVFLGWDIAMLSFVKSTEHRKQIETGNRLVNRPTLLAVGIVLVFLSTAPLDSLEHVANKVGYESAQDAFAAGLISFHLVVAACGYLATTLGSVGDDSNWFLRLLRLLLHKTPSGPRRRQGI